MGQEFALGDRGNSGSARRTLWLGTPCHSLCAGKVGGESFHRPAPPHSPDLDCRHRGRHCGLRAVLRSLHPDLSLLLWMAGEPLVCTFPATCQYAGALLLAPDPKVDRRAEGGTGLCASATGFPHIAETPTRIKGAD